ncbi:unnamed protein product, partial [Meganyctiphanes norvegica]
MLSWLKRRAKLTINSRYIGLLRRNINSDMFVSDLSLPNQQNIKLVVINSEGRDFSVDVPADTSVERVKTMAVGHFFNPIEAVGGPPDDKGGENVKISNVNGVRKYRLVLVREARPLLEDSSCNFEQLIENDELLLVERREPPAPTAPQDTRTPIGLKVGDSAPPDLTQITSATANLPTRNANRDPDPAHHNIDFQTEFRRILVTMIEVSVRLISADPDADEVFTQILDKLERRHRPRVDKNYLRQLTEMGFQEARATKALLVKRNVMEEAMEWLLEQGDEGSTNSGTNSSGSSNSGTSSGSTSTEDTESEQQPEDPPERILKAFRNYRKKWFQPNARALRELTRMGFPEDKVTEALRMANNVQSTACEILLEERSPPPDDIDQGLERESPIISAILASPVIQLALPKPKTLLALMMLFESPNNANMWLSDPDTHPVVSQVLRIYHAEKHSLSHIRTNATAISLDRSASTGNSSSSSNVSINTSISESGGAQRVPTLPVRMTIGHTGNSVSLMQDLNNAPGQYPTPFHVNIRTVNSSGTPNNGVSIDPAAYTAWLSDTSSATSSPLLRQHSSSPNSSPVPTRINQYTSSSPIPTPRPLEEPMSHSGSPVRGTTAVGRSNGEVPQLTPGTLTLTMLPPGPDGQPVIHWQLRPPVIQNSATPQNSPTPTPPNPTAATPATTANNTDVDMDEGPTDSQDHMDT